MVTFYKVQKIDSRAVLTGLIFTFLSCGGFISADAQVRYKAPQDTVSKKRSSADKLTTYQTNTRPFVPGSRMVGAAVKAADILKDTTKYDTKTGVAVEQLFQKEDLEYLSKQGVNNIVALFELVNKYLPKPYTIAFKTGVNETVTTGKNPLVLNNLRAIIRSKPATIQDHPQWKENVFQAYMARDYGTALENTITITSATREIRETPSLTLIDYNGSPVTLSKILAQQQAKYGKTYEAEKMAVLEFRTRTYPGSRISKEDANENYKRALFTLIDLQQNDLTQHAQTKALIADLAQDIQKGSESNAVNSLKNNHFFDLNVPGNLGPVLLTEDSLINAEQLKNNAQAKALEITMLVALHYGERDAVKLLRKLINNQGSVLAQQSGDFSLKRLGELTDHGTEKLKSLGFTKDRTANMTSSDLVLMAVASPETPVIATPEAFINLQQAGSSIVNQYTIITQTQDTRSTILFNPRIRLGSRHTEYRASFDAVDFVPEILDGVNINQKGSRITQNGIEMRLESDIYFSNPQKIINKGVKPVIYPEFGVIAGIGKRNVGDDNSTTVGRQGAVPKFNNSYINWGGHVGLNVGPVMLGMDATFITTGTNSDAYRRFFDLSQGMTYYRYSLLLHIMNIGVGNIQQGGGARLLLDGEFSGETNNSGFRNRSISKGGTAQIGNDEWSRDYDRAHPNGVYDAAAATSLIINGDVKANYASSNYGALHLAVQKSNLEIKGTVGLYNLYTVGSADFFNGKLFNNTFKGNLFGAIGISYNFGSKMFSKHHTRKETYETINSVESPHKIDETSGDDKQTDFGPRNHAIFVNKRNKATTPAPVATPTDATVKP